MENIAKIIRSQTICLTFEPSFLSVGLNRAATVYKTNFSVQFRCRLRQPLFHGLDDRQLVDVATPRHVQGVGDESVSELRPNEGADGAVDDGGHAECVPRSLLHRMSGQSALHKQGGRSAVSGGMSAVRGRWRRRRWFIQIQRKPRRIGWFIECGSSGGGGSCLLVPRPVGRPGRCLPDAVRLLVDRQRCRVLWQAIRHLRRPVPASAHPYGLRSGRSTECSGRRRYTAQSSAFPAHLSHPAAESAVGGPLSSVR